MLPCTAPFLPLAGDPERLVSVRMYQEPDPASRLDVAHCWVHAELTALRIEVTVTVSGV